MVYRPNTFISGAIFESKAKADRSQVAQAVERQLQERGKWSRPIYQAFYLATQSPLLNKQVTKVQDKLYLKIGLIL